MTSCREKPAADAAMDAVPAPDAAPAPDADPVVADWPRGFCPDADLGRPGEFPFTRGVHSSMYSGRVWTMRQYAGFGTAEETNRRYRFLLERGTTGLSVAFDLPTQMGLDSDAALAAGEVGRVGVAVDSLADVRTLFRDIPLDRISCSMTINATAPILLALYVALADEQGVPRSLLRGTVQNDILKEYVARGTYVHPVRPSLRLVGDVVAFCAREMPRWNPVSVSGYHIREAGSTAAQEVGFTLANGLEYAGQARSRGLSVEDFAPRMSFFFAAHNDLFEEVAKFRAARRIWARLMRDRFGAPDSCCRLRFHAQTGGSTLTAQQPMNNVVRVTVQALAAVLGGTQSLHTNGYDEALGLPSADAAALALRTQQVLAEESGVVAWADPMGGSFVIETLTQRLEAGALACMKQVEAHGGSAGAIEFMRKDIHRAAYDFHREVESGVRAVVGVNRHQSEDLPDPPVQPDYQEMEARQKTALAVHRDARDGEEVERGLRRVRGAASGDDNLLPAMIGAVKAGATLGEISDELRSVWGTYRNPA